MYSKLLCVVLLCLSLSKESFVYGKDIKVQLWDNSHPDSWILGIIHTYGIHPDYSANCRRHITSADRPCFLRIEIDYNLPINCFWTIDAGLGERVFINELLYTAEPNEPNKESSNRSKNYPNDDALNLSIYDGNQVNESKRLFKLGDKKLENVMSTGRNLTVTLDFKKSDIYKTQFIVLKISYIP